MMIKNLTATVIANWLSSGDDDASGFIASFQFTLYLLKAMCTIEVFTLPFYNMSCSLMQRNIADGNTE
jgi:hypothetical protein